MACHHCCATEAKTEQYRKVLWFALGANFLMFVVEILAGLQAGSVSLLSDSLDFFGDAANYSVSLLVLSQALTLRAKASLLKGATMALFGLWILGVLLWNLWHGELPQAAQMGAVGIAALITNVVVAWALFAFREGDSNMQSVWLCSRNDAIGNIAVIIAAVAVYYFHSNLPDLLVASAMALLSLQAAYLIIRRALAELRA